MMIFKHLFYQIVSGLYTHKERVIELSFAVTYDNVY